MSLASLRQNSGPPALAGEDLIGLVTSRICHDLVSPIGAIDNGVELMTAIAGTPHSAEMGLIGESARVAGLKLRLFRIAFGAAGHDSSSRAEELHQVFEGNFRRNRLNFTWSGGPCDMSRTEAKLAALALLCAESALPFGGQMQLRVERSRIAIALSGERLRWTDDIWTALASSVPFGDIAAGQVQFPIARIHAEQLGRQFHLQDGPEGKILTV